MRKEQRHGRICKQAATYAAHDKLANPRVAIEAKDDEIRACATCVKPNEAFNWRVVIAVYVQLRRRATMILEQAQHRRVKLIGSVA